MPATQDPAPVPFPVSTFPGGDSQESGGRLINCYAEPLGEANRPTGPSTQVWRRSPGLSLHAQTPQTGYRGGLIVNNLSYETWANEAATVDASGNVILLGNFPGTKNVSIARNQAANPDVVAVDLDNGLYILNTTAVANATVTATIAGGAFNNGDSVSLTFVNPSVNQFPVTVIYTLGAAETATTVATGLKNLINANATLAAANLTAASAAGVITISQVGAIGNNTFLLQVVTGTGSETVTFNPVSGQMSGGAGTSGVTFTGAPLFYNAGGVLPQPNSVCFQDGYFFLTIANNKVYATAVNALNINSLTFITVQARQDALLLRGIAFNGLLLLFTTGSLEFWQDAGNAAPAFPYSRLLVKDVGLIQPTAIAGWETGFAELLWAAQDYGVYWLTPANPTSPQKVSPPDLDRLIEAAVRAGVTLEAGVFTVAGQKFWSLSSPTWTWEFNVTRQKWIERWSVNASSVYGRQRQRLGHPAFGKWLVGDLLTGNLLWVDSQNYTEMGNPLLFRIESGPVTAFPSQVRIARADFNFDMGKGIAVGNFRMLVTGAANNGSGLIRLTVNDTSQCRTNDQVNVSGVTGTTEANGSWQVTVIDFNHIDLQGSAFANAYVSGGIAIDVTSPPNAINPVCAISRSLDGGVNWNNPLIRQIGVQQKTKRYRASVKNLGLAGPMGDRWRVDVTDPVYVGFLGATQSSNPREIGA